MPPQVVNNVHVLFVTACHTTTIPLRKQRQQPCLQNGIEATRCSARTSSRPLPSEQRQDVIVVVDGRSDDVISMLQSRGQLVQNAGRGELLQLDETETNGEELR